MSKLKDTDFNKDGSLKQSMFKTTKLQKNKKNFIKKTVFSKNKLKKGVVPLLTNDKDLYSPLSLKVVKINKKGVKEPAIRKFNKLVVSDAIGVVLPGFVKKGKDYFNDPKAMKKLLGTDLPTEKQVYSLLNDRSIFFNEFSKSTKKTMIPDLTLIYDNIKAGDKLLKEFVDDLFEEELASDTAEKNRITENIKKLHIDIIKQDEQFKKDLLAGNANKDFVLELERATLGEPIRNARQQEFATLSGLGQPIRNAQERERATLSGLGQPIRDAVILLTDEQQDILNILRGVAPVEREQNIETSREQQDASLGTAGRLSDIENTMFGGGGGLPPRFNNPFGFAVPEREEEERATLGEGQGEALRNAELEGEPPAFDVDNPVLGRGPPLGGQRQAPPPGGQAPPPGGQAPPPGGQAPPPGGQAPPPGGQQGQQPGGPQGFARQGVGTQNTGGAGQVGVVATTEDERALRQAQKLSLVLSLMHTPATSVVDPVANSKKQRRKLDFILLQKRETNRKSREKEKRDRAERFRQQKIAQQFSNLSYVPTN